MKDKQAILMMKLHLYAINLQKQICFQGNKLKYKQHSLLDRVVQGKQLIQASGDKNH